MDIDLLSKMVKELILDNDKVVLPGLGAFVAEIVPASFADKGYTINPPYRRLYFRSRPDEGEALAQFYASTNNVELAVADRIIKDFVVELKSVLYAKKVVVFPGLGRLRATKENTVFFVADEDLDIYPDGFGLEPISLKTHNETSEEVAAAVVGLRNILDETDEAESKQQEVPEIELAEEQEAGQSQEDTPEMELNEPEELVGQAEGESIPEEIIQEPETMTPITDEPEPESEPESGEPEPDTEASEVGSDQTETEPEQAPHMEQKSKKKSSGFWKVMLWIVIIYVLLAAAFAAVSHLFPGIADSLLYSPEELEILNY